MVASSSESQRRGVILAFNEKSAFLASVVFTTDLAKVVPIVVVSCPTMESVWPTLCLNQYATFLALIVSHWRQVRILYLLAQGQYDNCDKGNHFYETNWFLTCFSDRFCFSRCKENASLCHITAQALTRCEKFVFMKEL